MIPAFLSKSPYIQADYEVNRFSKRNLGGIASVGSIQYDIYRPLVLTEKEEGCFYSILHLISIGVKLKYFVFKDYPLI